MVFLDSQRREWARARHAFAVAQLELRRLRISVALKRFNPSQPRVPAGHPDGGQWTGDGSGGDDPRVTFVSARPRRGGGRARVINGRVYETTPSQEVRLDVSAAHARALVQEVRRHDPNWRPRPSIYEGVEGEILANEADAMQAAARLRELGGREPIGQPIGDTIMPNGQWIGVREGHASSGIRTVPPSEFGRLLEAISPGAQVVPSPPGYLGLWYRQSDGSIFGVRRSEEHGITLDVIRSNHPAVRSGDKVHQK